MLMSQEKRPKRKMETKVTGRVGKTGTHREMPCLGDGLPPKCVERLAPSMTNGMSVDIHL